MQSMKFLFDKIKLRIRSNPIFSANIHYPSSQHVKGTPSIWVNQDDDDRIYVCTYMYISWDNQLIDYELTRGFLSSYNYHEVLRIHCSAHTYKVIYEIQQDNFS